MSSPTKPRVVVTAGASGIGYAMAEAFAEAGSDVWITDVNAKALAACPDTWRRSEIDASDEAGVAGLFAEIENDWQGLDTLCANAGIAGPTATVDNISLDDWQRCVSVNLEGAFLACKYAIPFLKQQRSGTIVLTSSTAGLYGFPLRAPYVSAKWAVLGLMKTLAMELGEFGIRANAICPGPVEGERMDNVIAREAAAKGMSEEAVRTAYAAGTSMRTFVSAGDIAALAVFLASPKARHISGQTISVDGHTVNPDPQI